MYSKLSKINSGGFGTVFRAKKASDKRIRALKELSSGASESDVKRFAREVRIQARLKHRNIVPILAHYLDVEPPFFVMPLAKGTVREELASIAGDLAKVSWAMRDIFAGLQHAHERGVVHRDLKPENLLIFEGVLGRRVAISDFGLGKRLDFETLTITRSHESMGTAAYMPPEQYYDFRNVGAAGDVFSLGKILYELLTGELPIHVNLKHPALSGGFAYLVAKCLEHEPSNRYASVAELWSEFNLLVDTPEKLSEPTQQAADLLETIREAPDDVEALGLLDELLRQYEGDSAFYLAVFPEISRSILSAYLGNYRHRFHARLRTFDSHLKEAMDFAYTDKVTRLYRKICEYDDSPEVLRLVLERLFTMGCSHNRFFVRDELCSLLSGLREQRMILVARDVIRKHPREAKWCAGALERFTLPALLRETFVSIEQQLQGRAL